jgi:hypothetical protein
VLHGCTKLFIDRFIGRAACIVLARLIGPQYLTFLRIHTYLICRECFVARLKCVVCTLELQRTCLAVREWLDGHYIFEDEAPLNII